MWIKWRYVGRIQRPWTERTGIKTWLSKQPRDTPLGGGGGGGGRRKRNTVLGKNWRRSIVGGLTHLWRRPRYNRHCEGWPGWWRCAPATCGKRWKWRSSSPSATWRRRCATQTPRAAGSLLLRWSRHGRTNISTSARLLRHSCCSFTTHACVDRCQCMATLILTMRHHAITGKIATAARCYWKLVGLKGGTRAEGGRQAAIGQADRWEEGISGGE